MVLKLVFGLDWIRHRDYYPAELHEKCSVTVIITNLWNNLTNVVKSTMPVIYIH